VANLIRPISAKPQGKKHRCSHFRVVLFFVFVLGFILLEKACAKTQQKQKTKCFNCLRVVANILIAFKNAK
jgi:predicted membrane chloride channel (bestrophin family)